MSVRPEVSAMVEYLNSLLDLDPAFVSALIQMRAPCNEAIALHPTVQVGMPDGHPVAGFLGVVNGFLGTIDHGKHTGWGPITVAYDSDGAFFGFVETARLPS
jgi:hypothetical protein